MEKSKCLYGLVAVAFLLCSSKLVAMKEGGPCTYSEIPGSAVIRSVSSVNITEVRADEFPEVEVRFDFFPDNPSKKSETKSKKAYGESNVMTYHGRTSIPKDWVEEKGLKVGNQLIATKKVIAQGTCSPVAFVFPELKETH